MNRNGQISTKSKSIPANSKGSLSIDVVMDPAGQVKAVKVVRDKLDNQNIIQTVLRHIRQLRFPSNENKGLVVNYRLEFQLE